jgi:hypothetical protein
LAGHQRANPGRSQLSKESASFLKKRSKKLLLNAGCGNGSATAPRSKSLFASFSSEKEALTDCQNNERPDRGHFETPAMNPWFGRVYDPGQKF